MNIDLRPDLMQPAATCATCWSRFLGRERLFRVKFLRFWYAANSRRLTGVLIFHGLIADIHTFLSFLPDEYLQLDAKNIRFLVWNDCRGDWWWNFSKGSGEKCVFLYGIFVSAADADNISFLYATKQLMCHGVNVLIPRVWRGNFIKILSN